MDDEATRAGAPEAYRGLPLINSFLGDEEKVSDTLSSEPERTEAYYGVRRSKER
jgi:hypothetical protein